MSIKLTTPLREKEINNLNIGDKIFLSGYIYTARDIAHKKLVNLINENKTLPFDIKGGIIYYMGPTPEQPEQVIGSAGPTTSCRMDPYVNDLLKAGMKGMIGKGGRSKQVVNNIKKYKAVYFGATGGAGALLSKTIVSAEIIAFPELGTEAIRKLKVKDMPLVIINDCNGNDLYVEGRKKWEIK